jgi:hypothetical protein
MSPLGVVRVRGGHRADLPEVGQGGARIMQRLAEPVVAAEGESDVEAGLPS